MEIEYKTTNPELAILGLIAERPLHGYEVEQVVAQRGMRQWTDIGFSSIYHVLNKLAAWGLLEAELQAATPRPARRVYHLTQDGAVILRREVRVRLCSPRLHSGDFDLALAFAIVLPPEEILSALDEQKQSLQSQLERLQAQWDMQRGEKGFPPHVNELFSHTTQMMRAELDWLNGCRERFAQNLNRPHPGGSIRGDSHD